MKRMIYLVVCLAFLGASYGCETLKGAAKDIENTGKNINDFLTGNK